MDPIVHFEIPVKNLDKAKKFYGPTFGWKLDDWKMPDGSVYVGVHTTPIDEETRMPLKPGAINGGITDSTVIKAPVFAIQVESIEDKVKLVEKAGGKRHTPKQEIMGMGYYAYVTDPDGNVLGLWENMKK